MRDPLQALIVATAVASLAVALPWIAARFRRPLAVTGEPPRPSLLRHPWALFLITSGLCLLNQVAVNAYILVVQRGDPWFITQYVGTHYFLLDLEFPGVRALAAAVGPDGAKWLAPSILRVNAFLELPFALFAYLSIAWLFDRGAVRFLLRSGLGALACASFTIVLMAVEVMLWNPYTPDDLAIRVVAGVATAGGLFILGRRERGGPTFPTPAGRPKSLISVGIALVGAVSAAGALLGLYDATLLYNLGGLGKYGYVLAFAIFVATLAFPASAWWDEFVERLLGRPLRRSPAIEALTSVAATLSVIFLVPSLAVRYSLSTPAGRAVGFACVAVAVVWGLVHAARAPGLDRVRWGCGLAFGAAAGGWALSTLWLNLKALPAPEPAILVGAFAFLAPLALVWRVAELAGLNAAKKEGAA